jgi:hypothetical protein
LLDKDFSSEVQVPRYYFDVHSGDMERDDEGIECLDLEEVKKRAKDLHARVVNRGMQSSEDQLECRVFVRNHNDEIIYMCTFSYSGAWISAASWTHLEPQRGSPDLVQGLVTGKVAKQVFTPGR